MEDETRRDRSKRPNPLALSSVPTRPAGFYFVVGLEFEYGSVEEIQMDRNFQARFCDLVSLDQTSLGKIFPLSYQPTFLVPGAIYFIDENQAW